MNVQHSNSTPTHLIEFITSIENIPLMIMSVSLFSLLTYFFGRFIFYCCKKDNSIPTASSIDSDTHREPLAPTEIIGIIANNQNSYRTKGKEKDFEQDPTLEEVEDNTPPRYNQLF